MAFLISSKGCNESNLVIRLHLDDASETPSLSSCMLGDHVLLCHRIKGVRLNTNYLTYSTELTHLYTHTHTSLSHATAGPRPLGVFLKAYFPRMVMGVVFALLVWWTSYIGNNGQFPLYYYAILILAFALHQVKRNSFVAVLYCSSAEQQSHIA